MIRQYGKDINITLATCAFGLRPGSEGDMPRHMEAALKAGFDGFEISQISGVKPEDLLAAVKSFPAKIKMAIIHIQSKRMISVPMEPYKTL